jgi:signal transduction histidine kinase/DNA-binding response OmpR family regulator
MMQQHALLVDNDPNFLNVFSDILTMEGYHVRTVSDGKEALSEIHRNPPDVLFTDLIIPKISGEQLIRYVRDDPAIAPMVIVVVSGAILEYSGHERIAADYFITKSNIHSFQQQILILSQKIRSSTIPDRMSFGRTLITDQSLRSRKIVEELLNDRRHILQVLENLHAGLLVYDTDLRILSANPAAEILLEKPISQILGNLVENQFEKKYHAILQARLKPGDADQELDGHLTVHSQDRILDMNISHLEDSLDGYWQGGLVLLVDVTRMEKLHGYLESAARVASMLLKRENAHDQVFRVLEIMGKAAGASRSYWYRNSRDVSGNVWMSLKSEWCADGVCSQSSLADLQQIYYRAGFSRWYAELSADRIISGAVKDFPESESRFLQSMGIRSVLIIPLLIKGCLEGFIGFDNCTREAPWKDPEIHLMRMATDSLAKAFDYEMSLIEKNKLEDQLLHAQRMKFMGEISAGLSHNFRNLLAGILGNAEWIRLKYPTEAEIQKCAGSIINIAQLGSDLISGLMKFSRLESRGPNRVFNLGDTLQECCQIVSASFDGHIKIQQKWPELIAVEGNPSELSQVFMNLFTNARDAMPDGGTLLIEAKEADHQIVIRISDTGCGMAEETTRRIFDPFFTTKEAGQGTGLGLSTAYGIVHNYGGDIQVFSQQGLGTVFTVVLPVSNGLDPPLQPEDEMLIPGHGEKILLVDDDEAISGILKELLECNGYIVTIAGSGRESVSLYPGCRPDVVLMDRNMPVMDGIAAATEILKIDPAARIIIASGYEAEGPDGVPAHLRNVIKGYIVKPFEIARLSKLLAEVLIP